jgi:esterase/lipase
MGQRHISLIILIALFMLLAGCDSGPAHLQRSSHAVGVPDPDVPFAEYLTDTRAQLRQALSEIFYADATQHFGPAYPLDRVLNMRAPFEIPPAATCDYSARTTGFLLIHGLSDSPYLLSAVARSLSEANPCSHVRSILLPGHGSSPADALAMHRRQWQQAAEYGINSFRGEVDELYVLGYSAGATLAVQYADQHRDDPFLAGLILLSPAMDLPRSSVWLSPYVRWFSRWVGIERETDAAKYESFAINAGAEFYLLIRELRWRRMQPLDIPVFMAVSGDDATVDAFAAEQFFCERTESATRRMIWYQSASEASHNLSLCEGTLVVPVARPELRTISGSHVGITMPPEDPHYGFDAAYRQCLHYGEQPDLLQQCRQDDSATVYGERSLMSEDMRYQGQLLRRTTFNPHFDGMMQQIQCFVESGC